MRKNKSVLFGFILFFGALCSSCNNVQPPVKVVPKENVTRDTISSTSKDSVVIPEVGVIASPNMEIPATENEKLIVHHTAYSLLYSEEH